MLTKIQKNNKLKKRSESLCFDCANACGNCSWSARYKPVKGWTAKKTIICNRVCETKKDILINSYFVFSCPNFKPDRVDYFKRERIIKKFLELPKQYIKGKSELIAFFTNKDELLKIAYNSNDKQLINLLEIYFANKEIFKGLTENEIFKINI